MNREQARDALETQIIELVRARDEIDDPQERAAASEAIELLQDEADRIDILIADQLGAKIDKIIEDLDEILNEKALDAGSALGRTIRRLREFVDDPTAGG